MRKTLAIRMAALAATALLALAAAACSGGGGGADDAVVADSGDTAPDPGPVDPGPDATDPGPADTATDLEGDGAELPDAADAPGDTGPYVDGAHAFVSTSADQLIGGVQAAGVVGDIVIQNARVRFVVRNQARSLFSPYGGALVDADVVRPAGEIGHDKFLEVFPMTGFGRVFKPTHMEIVDDGTWSGTALVRFTGTDGGLTIVDSLLPTAPAYLEVTTDYVLGPDAQHLEIATTIRNAGGWVDPLVVGQLLQFGKRLDKFHDHCGPDQDCLASRTDVRWMAAQGGDVSYGFTVPAGEHISMLLAVEELMLLQAGTVTLAKDESATFRQFLAVGKGTVDDVLPILQALRGEAPGVAVPLSVSLSDPLSAPADVRVRARRTDDTAAAYVDATIPGADGQGTLHLPAGTYDLEVVLPGADDAVTTGVAVTEGTAAPVALAANPAGWLHVLAKDGDGKPLTAALTLQKGLDAPWTSGIERFEAIRDGDWRIPVPAGDYTATLAKGLLWNIDRKNVTVAAGSETALEGIVTPAIDTTGSVTVNTHEHCEYSIDSFVAAENRVYNAVANGIQVMNPTDHDHYGTHQPTIEKLGLQEQVHSFFGCEVSPMWGHTTNNGCLPPPGFYEQYYSLDFLEYDADGGVVRNLTPNEIYRQSRDDMSCKLVAVNHPYRGEATFQYYGITSTSNPADLAAEIDLHLVDAMEVYNKSDDISTVLDQNLPAWFNLLNRGYHVAAIGGSDEHGYNGNYGNPRNLVPVSATGPADVDRDELFDHMNGFRGEVVGGPVLRLTVDGAGMGDTIAALGGTVQVRLQVLAPPWMALSFCRIYVNGGVALEPALADTTDLVRLDQTFELPLDTDAYVVAVAGSLQAGHQMTPVSPKLPVSVTNPVFVDVDGGGYKPIYLDGAPWDLP
jgi:hypothetical protein